ncbi:MULTISPECIES: efflux RND transporter periplasmic adaptor subunit [unclassified Sphingopyxis]|jgi:Cu(I)/Ag(I) efflux system membrane fusion protein|uniref:efflux RND transporter periplasmic adaptor subunit n=1 Tax=Sphingomonadales TaxID=204457 RepID=UPI0010F863DE|nr:MULTISPECIES: efflux RND transporter periplasmic adaptor subunit [unclassified Sphingopyxis]MBR2172926.1 efflux RND transporter periplasmic adaptor subunit [Sphingopyxis sp.]MDT7529890.1 efflux RND transporter periplasmic adaptor subunit [Sphingopyxis sp. SE2]
MIKNKKILAAGVALVVALAAAGYWFSMGEQPSAGSAKGDVVNGVAQDGSGRVVKYWYDPMVPMERYNAPGKSSMNMDLQPKYADEGGDSGGIRVSSQTQQNLGVRTARVVFDRLAPAVTAIGRVETDERRIVEVQTLTAGFVEQLSVRAVGEAVTRGSRVAAVYAPDLLGAQNEYVALLKIPGSVITPDLRRATRQRLVLLGLPEPAIRNLERGGHPQRTYGVFAPRSGIVTAIGARPGARVEPGQSILTLADLSQVLVVAEVPEISLGQIRVGQSVKITFPAYPGETREGRIDYIFPTLDAEARTVRVRIALPNPAGRLKIGMFANLEIAGSPTGALVAPTEAVIVTGKRNVVIVQRGGVFIPVEVELGRTVGDKTEIRRGLAANDVVVVSGQFLIDSEASLAGVIERLSQGQAAAAPQQAQTSLIEGRGVITALDLGAGRVTLSHGPIPAIEWPAMTMTFPVKNAALLRGRKTGERVRFSFQKPQQGQTPVIERMALETAQ